MGVSRGLAFHDRPGSATKGSGWVIVSVRWCGRAVIGSEGVPRRLHRLVQPPQTVEGSQWGTPLTHCEVMLLLVSLTVAPEGARSLTASVGPVGTAPPWMV